ncbi:MAG: hypothetical protein UR94_C0024G0005 [Parcubacteria group bacterium GW2011_GWA2_36_10]|nr:MAG: hypothetical protein UR94_C0024G0005 [Parcubacteria group bacterium GW2011_GWA2_36_10]
MKKHTSIANWMTITAILIISNLAIAQPKAPSAAPPAATSAVAPAATPTQPAPLAISTTSFEDILVPWLMKNGQPVERLDWVKDQTTKKITFTRQTKCRTIVKEGEVKWLPKFNNDLESRLVFAQKSANRDNQMILEGVLEYPTRAADSLARIMRSRINDMELRRQIAYSSPFKQKMRQMESDINGIKAKLEDSTKFVEAKHFEMFLNTIGDVFESQGDFNHAVGEHLSNIKGRKHWEEMTEKYHLLVIDNQTTAPTPDVSQTPTPTLRPF